MADIELARAHTLGLPAAREAAERLAADLASRFGVRSRWDGDVLRFERPGVNGALTVSASDLRLSVTLGMLMRAMKGSIERGIAREVDALFPGSGPRRDA